MGEYADMANGAQGGFSSRRPTALRSVTCNRCKHIGLVWGQVDGGWRLHEPLIRGGRVHSCPKPGP